MDSSGPVRRRNTRSAKSLRTLGAEKSAPTAFAVGALLYWLRLTFGRECLS